MKLKLLETKKIIVGILLIHVNHTYQLSYDRFTLTYFISLHLFCFVSNIKNHLERLNV